MRSYCRYCEKRFSTTSNARRHEEKCSANEDYSTEAESENEEMKEENEGEDDISEEEANSSEEKDENSSEEEEEDDGDKDKGEKDNDSIIWGFLCRNAWEDMEIPEGQTSDELLEDKEFVKETNNEMRKKLTKWVQVVNFLQNHSETYAKIQKTIDRLMKNDEYDDNEATEKAFSDRKILINSIMKKNKHILEDVIQSEDDEDNNDDVQNDVVPPPQ